MTFYKFLLQWTVNGIKKESKRDISYWTKRLDCFSLMYVCVLFSHSAWAFLWYRFQDIYCISSPDYLYFTLKYVIQIYCFKKNVTVIVVSKRIELAWCVKVT